MKGIILAAGKGTRLLPLTKVTSKQLLPIFDKPMIYYPLSILILAGIKDILIITTPEDLKSFERLLGDGKQLGINLIFKVQDEPRGLVDAFIIGKEFIGTDSVCLILGDNILYGQDLSKLLYESVSLNEGAIIFGYPVKNPSEFGVVEFDNSRNVISLEEKPANPKSEYAIPGIYFYDNHVVDKALMVRPSTRGELEITDLNRIYLEEKKLKVKLLGRGFAWLDTGTIESMRSASEFIEAIQKRQGFYVSCIEEIAWRRGFISNNQLRKLAEIYKYSDYGKYIDSLVSESENRYIK